MDSKNNENDRKIRFLHFFDNNIKPMKFDDNLNEPPYSSIWSLECEKEKEKENENEDMAPKKKCLYFEMMYMASYCECNEVVEFAISYFVPYDIDCDDYLIYELKNAFCRSQSSDCIIKGINLSEGYVNKIMEDGNVEIWKERLSKEELESFFRCPICTNKINKGDFVEYRYEWDFEPNFSFICGHDTKIKEKMKQMDKIEERAKKHPMFDKIKQNKKRKRLNSF
jgi:hypothetical protein